MRVHLEMNCPREAKLFRSLSRTRYDRRADRVLCTSLGALALHGLHRALFLRLGVRLVRQHFVLCPCPREDRCGWTGKRTFSGILFCPQPAIAWWSIDNGQPLCVWEAHGGGVGSKR